MKIKDPSQMRLTSLGKYGDRGEALYIPAMSIGQKGGCGLWAVGLPLSYQKKMEFQQERSLLGRARLFRPRLARRRGCCGPRGICFGPCPAAPSYHSPGPALPSGPARTLAPASLSSQKGLLFSEAKKPY